MCRRNNNKLLLRNWGKFHRGNDFELLGIQNTEITLRCLSQSQQQEPVHWDVASHDGMFREQSVVQGIPE